LSLPIAEIQNTYAKARKDTLGLLDRKNSIFLIFSQKNWEKIRLFPTKKMGKTRKISKCAKIFEEKTKKN
jgi:hypothetical protein